MLIVFQAPRMHTCMDCGRIFDSGEFALNDRHGEPWALACIDRDECEERQMRRDAEPIYRGAPVSMPAPPLRPFLSASK